MRGPIIFASIRGEDFGSRRTDVLFRSFLGFVTARPVKTMVVNGRIFYRKRQDKAFSRNLGEIRDFWVKLTI